MTLEFRKSIRPKLAGIAWIATVFCVFSVSAAQTQLADDEGLPVVSWREARQVVGRVGMVYGKIIRIGHTEKIHFLNFARNDRQAFTAVVFSPHEKKFPDTLESLFQNQLVKIRGTVTLFRGNPQIVVTDPAQICVIDEPPKTTIPRQRMTVLGDELIIGSYNIKNLFDDNDDPYYNDETTAAKPRQEMEGVAAVIREFNPDVLALQEVESRGYLERFISTMLDDMGYQYIVHYEGNDHRGIDVCLISRVPIGAVTSHRHLVFRGADGGEQSFNRDLLQVEIQPENGDSFEMWVVHLKSNSGGREAAEPIRLGESRELHRIIAERLQREPAAEFILCGDFNDTFDSATLRTVLGQPPLLKAHLREIPEEQQITYNREPYRNMIDFLLCSPAMSRRYISNSLHVRLGSDLDTGSDHNPVYARFRKSRNILDEEPAPAVSTSTARDRPDSDLITSMAVVAAATPDDTESGTHGMAAAPGAPRLSNKRWPWLAYATVLGIVVLGTIALGFSVVLRRK